MRICFMLVLIGGATSYLSFHPLMDRRVNTEISE